MFAIIPLLALLTTFGLSTKHATPKPSPIVSMSPWIAYHVDGSFSSNPTLGTCPMDSARIPSGMYSFACRTEDGDTVLLSHRDTDEKTEALYTLFYMDADVSTVAYGSVDWSSGRTVWTLESDEKRVTDAEETALDRADSLHYLADSFRAIAGATVAADPMSNIPLDAFAVAHCLEFVARAAALDSIAGDAGNGWKSTCPTVRPLSIPPSPALVQVATRGNVAEPARATTCYLGLDCPE